MSLFAETLTLVTPSVLDALVLDPFQRIRILASAAFWQWEGEPDR